MVKKFAYKTTSNDHLQSFENLYCYYDSLDLADLKTVVKEEIYSREKLGYARLTNRAFENFKHAINLRREAGNLFSQQEQNILTQKTIFNHVNYDMLLNKKYQNLYQYKPVFYRNTGLREFAPKEYDFTRKMIDLPYWLNFAGAQKKMVQESNTLYDVD